MSHLPTPRGRRRLRIDALKLLRQRRVVHDHQVLVIITLSAIGKVVRAGDHCALVDDNYLVMQDGAVAVL